MNQCFGGTPLSSWDVIVDGAVIDTTPAANGTVWDSHAMDFIAAGASTTLCFRLAGGSGQGGIDNLSVALQ